MTHESTPMTTVTVEQLKPCPFCGAEPELREGHRDHWRVECPRCGGMRPGHYAYENAKARAITAWNTRDTERNATLERENAVLREALKKIAAEGGPARPGSAVATVRKIARNALGG